MCCSVIMDLFESYTAEILMFNLNEKKFMVLMSFCGETSNTLLNFSKSFPTVILCTVAHNLSVPLWRSPTTSPLLPHKPSLCSLTCTSYTKHSGLWVRLRWHSNFHIQKETRKFVCTAVSPFIPRQGREGMTSFLDC